MLSSVKDASLAHISLLSTQAWHHLGLVPIPGLDVTDPDLPQAKLAIDLYEAILQKVESVIDAGTARELKMNLTNLQMNFLNKSKQ